MVSGPPQDSAGSTAVLVRDERLARSVTDGDQAAFAELYERYQQPLLRYCRSILGGEADSQDAVQSAFNSAGQRCSVSVAGINFLSKLLEA